MRSAVGAPGCVNLRIVAVLWLFFAAPVVAIAEQLAIKTYTTENGLAHNRVKRILKDSHGFLWFCTADGLSRFDGYQFTNYRVEDGLPGPSVNDILETSDGVYWVATNGEGVARFDLREGRRASGRAAAPSRFTAQRISQEAVTNRVNILYRDRDRTLWAGTDGGLFRLDNDSPNAPFRPVTLGLPSHSDIQVQVWALIEDAGGSLWIGTSFGLVKRTRDGRMTHYQIHPSSTDDNVSALLIDSTGRLWIGHRAGLITFTPEAPPSLNRGARVSRRLPPDARRYTTRDGLDNDTVVAVHESDDGRMWIRTIGAGLTQFDGTMFRTYFTGRSVSDDVGSVVGDGEGNLWMGTNAGGALKVATHPWTTYGHSDGLGESISSIVENRAGELYVSSSGWLVSRFDGRKFATVRPHLPASVTDASWRSLSGTIQDHTGEWWIATREGLYRFGKVVRFEDLGRTPPKAVYKTRDGLAHDDLTRLFEDSRGDIWMTSWVPMPHALVRWDRATSSFHRYGEAEGLQPFASARTFAEDAAGSVWIGFRNGGLARFRNGRFTMLGQDDGLPVGGVNGIYVDRSNRLWVVVSGGGLSLIDDATAERPRVVRYTRADGMSTDMLLSVTGDAAGRIYLAGRRGIDRLDPETGTVKHYSTADGLAGGEITATMHARSGGLWFGTRTGLSRLDPDGEQPLATPPILIGALQIAGIDHPLSALGQAVVPRLELEANRNNVRIDFFSIGFRAGEMLRYQYQLEGAGPEWSRPSEQRSVNFANLSPGAYRFLVRAVSTEGIRSSSPASVTFTILPPLWRRWWFLGLVALATSCAVAVVVRSRHQRLKALRDSENRFRTLAETASDAIITVDEDSRIVLVNYAAERVFGYTREEMIGAELLMLMPADLRQRHRPGFARHKRTHERHIVWEGIELPGLHKDGHEVPLEISFGEFVRNDQRFFTGIARDITERKRAEDALRRSRDERLAELERVRQRIATDLHDDVGSSLTRISLLSEVVRHQLGDVSATTAASLTSIAGLSRELIDSMSDIVWAINPSKDHLSDLSQRMRHFVSDVCTARQIDFRFHTPASELDIMVGANIRREVFLLFKEAVNNMVRHSACSTAELEFRATERGLRLRVADNGHGFDAASHSRGHGLRSMHERTASLGGRLEILSGPGRGTILTFTIPLGGEAHPVSAVLAATASPHEHAVTHRHGSA
jgi:PAS domain S-box-containing protein